MPRDKKDTLALFEVLRDDKHGGKKDTALKTPRWWRRGPVAPATPPAASGNLTLGAAVSPAVPPKRGVWFRLTATHLVVVCVLVVAIAATAFALGRGRSPKPQMSTPTSEELKKQAPNPDVLAVREEAPGEQTPAPPAPPVPPARDVSEDHGRATVGNGVTPPSGSRSTQLNYIIVQSYPEPTMAEEARDFLARHSIPCTVEKGLACAPGQYSVTTVAGFEKISSREYLDYVQKIKAASARFPTPRFGKFNPYPFKWR